MNSPTPEHVPVLLEPILQLLSPSAGQTVVDCTTGRAGHALALAEKLGPSGTLIGLDTDPRNLEFARQRLSSLPCRVRLFHANFAQLDEVWTQIDRASVHVILADLGVSTNQLFDSRYGLSFAQDMPLDMRLDPESGPSAADLVNNLPADELADVLYELAQERHSRRIARKIVDARVQSPITSTERLAEIVRSAIPSRDYSREKIDPATRTFLALRMKVNREMENLATLLETAPRMLARDGRLGIISFQSMEDRQVKQAFRSAEQTGLVRITTKKPLSPTESEIAANPRSRSAKLRVVEKLQGSAMTKETKIGLLAGLAFIIVIGIVLSDHLTSSTEPPPAILGGVGNNVRAQIANPSRTENPVAVIIPPMGVSPRTTVPTPGDLENQQTANAVVRVGPPSISTQSNPIIVRSGTPQAPPVATQNPPAVERSVANTSTPNTPLQQIATQNGEPLVGVGATQTQTGVGSTGATTDYTVQPGDTLGHIAGRLMGSSNPNNIAAILAANPVLGGNANKIIVGKTYKIPSATSVASSAVSAPAPAPTPAAQTNLSTAQTASITEYWYTVKDGDSLWKIANEQLGTGGNGVAAIKELNKDTLKGGETIFINMRLKLPGKPIAQAN